ncbi:MaoC family dehydratase [Zavarzinia sp. CC-PAN008]|uniref:MaoC family dehydratase n=1 Tax=Zavarzinia sp. CC-PAN008 TaxID=3243332 RepID=UPI003F748D4F
MPPDFKERAVLWPKGRQFEDFAVGQVFAHHWGRTINHGDNSIFTTLTLNYNPLYFNREYAMALGHPDVVVNPLLVFNTVFGLTVEDCSEGGGPFVGVDDVTYHRPVYPNDTLTARSTTVDARTSKSNPANGLVTWHTEGRNQRDELVIDFKRTNIVRLRNPPARTVSA